MNDLGSIMGQTVTTLLFFCIIMGLVGLAVKLILWVINLV